MRKTPYFENRELSWLRFNERVLEEAEDERVPLCERLNFLSIFQTNLDEFLMVRIGSLHDGKIKAPKTRDNKTNMTYSEQMDACLIRIHELCRRRDLAYASLQARLNEQGISIVNFRSIGKKAESIMTGAFKKEFQPFLSFFFVENKQSLPFLNNKDIYAVAMLGGKQERKKLVVVPCSGTVFPRLIPVPDRTNCYVLAEELILHCLPVLFPGSRILGKTLVRITRNADIDADNFNGNQLNYRDHMTEVLKIRKKLCAVRLEVSREINSPIVAILRKYYKLKMNQVFEYDSPLELSFFLKIRDQLRDHEHLFYPQQFPQQHPYINDKMSIIQQIKKRDIMLHYPYNSIRPFLRLLYEASNNPNVTSIKMTLYRLASDSKVVEALVDAAENGKKVEVFVELKARFDEENNIEWSRRLERAGCQVIYGMKNIKVHSKLCLITLGKNKTEQYITQIGTGNYNEKTSRFYTDICLMTYDYDIGREALMIFESLKRFEMPDTKLHLLVSPKNMRDHLIDLIDVEISKAKSGEKASISLKMNSVTDRELMDKLIDASHAGVRIRMIVRGICCLIGGAASETENIHVISIVGRYLEHSRIYIFGEGANSICYISSADWMTRNMSRRVEIACPVRDPMLIREVEHIFRVLWNDNLSARDQLPDGSYKRRMPSEKRPLRAQDYLYQEAVRLANRKKDMTT